MKSSVLTSLASLLLSRVGYSAKRKRVCGSHLLVLMVVVALLQAFPLQTIRAQGDGVGGDENGFGDNTEPVLETTVPGGFTLKVSLVGGDVLPPAYDWREHNVSLRVENQGSCGSCWAFAFIKAYEAKLQVKKWGMYDLSEQQLVNKADTGGCCGGSFGAAFQLLESVGPVEERGWPYQEGSTRSCDCKTLKYCSRDQTIPKGSDEKPADLTSTPVCDHLVFRVIDRSSIRPQDKGTIKQSLLADGPAYLHYNTNATWDDFWHRGQRGQVFKSDRSRRGGHAVTLIGWSDERNAWLCHNSWGTGGPNGDGTFWMDYDEPQGVQNYDIQMGQTGRIEEGFKEWRKDIHPASLLPREGGGRIWHGESATWYLNSDETTAGSRDIWDSAYVCTSSYAKVCALSHEAYSYIKLFAGTGTDARDFGTSVVINDQQKCVHVGLEDFHKNQRLGGTQIYSWNPGKSGGFAINVHAGKNGIDVEQIYAKLTYDKYVAPWPNPYEQDTPSGSTAFNVGVGASDDLTTVLSQERFIELTKGKCVSVSTYHGSMAGRRYNWQSGAIPDYPTGDALTYVRALFIGDSGSEQQVAFADLIDGKVFSAPENGLMFFYSDLPASYADKRGGCILEVQICDCVEFKGCGVLVEGRAAGCTLFLADRNQLYYLDKLDRFKVGDQVWVQGMIACSCGNSPCEEEAGKCITVTTIKPCCDADFCQYDAPGQGFSPVSILPGQTLNLTFGWANCGTASIAPGWHVRFYASVDTTITSSDYFLQEVVVNTGAARGQQLTFSTAVAIPANLPGGQYYIGWIFDSDNQVCESNENNNAGYLKTGRLTVIGPCSGDFCQYDAPGQGFSPSTVQVGKTINLTLGWANCGAASISPGWRVRFYASLDTTITSSDYLLQEVVVNTGASPGQQLSLSVVLTIPTTVPAGQYYIGWIFDPGNLVCESNENNNAGYLRTGRLTVTSACGADFCQYDAPGQGFSPTTIQAGQYLTLTHGWANCGTTSIASGWRIRYYASVDTAITSADYLIYEDTVNSAASPGQQVTRSVTFKIPSTVPEGQYYIGWIFDPDNQICESNENNNAGYVRNTRLRVITNNFEGCGVLVAFGGWTPMAEGATAASCLLFRADDTGDYYYLDNTGGFHEGDRVYVKGSLNLSCQSSYCGQPVRGCIIVIIIIVCPGEPGGSFEGCGVLVAFGGHIPLAEGATAASCLLFKADDTGDYYYLDNTGGFHEGDRVYVRGSLNLSCQSSYCGQPVRGCIIVIIIIVCPGEGTCCDFSPADRVVLLVRPLNNDGTLAVGLYPGAMGTVVCCDHGDPGLPLFVSWDNWTNGKSNSSFCDPPVISYTPNSGWWMACTQIGRPGQPVESCPRALMAKCSGKVIALKKDPANPSTYTGRTIVTLESNFTVTVIPTASAISSAGGTWTATATPSTVGPNGSFDLYVRGTNVNASVLPCAVTTNAANVDLSFVLAP